MIAMTSEMDARSLALLFGTLRRRWSSSPAELRAAVARSDESLMGLDRWLVEARLPSPLSVFADARLVFRDAPVETGRAASTSLEYVVDGTVRRSAHARSDAGADVSSHQAQDEHEERRRPKREQEVRELMAMVQVALRLEAAFCAGDLGQQWGSQLNAGTMSYIARWINAEAWWRSWSIVAPLLRSDFCTFVEQHFGESLRRRYRVGAAEPSRAAEDALASHCMLQEVTEHAELLQMIPSFGTWRARLDAEHKRQETSFWLYFLPKEYHDVQSGFWEAVPLAAWTYATIETSPGARLSQPVAAHYHWTSQSFLVALEYQGAKHGRRMFRQQLEKWTKKPSAVLGGAWSNQPGPRSGDPVILLTVRIEEPNADNPLTANVPVERRTRLAIVEFYRSLGFVPTYSSKQRRTGDIMYCIVPVGQVGEATS